MLQQNRKFAGPVLKLTIKIWRYESQEKSDILWHLLAAKIWWFIAIIPAWRQVLIYWDYISSEETCDIIQSSIKIGVLPDWCFLAILCNSKIIEIYGDNIRVSHGFEGCQSLTFIAESTTLALRIRNDDITGFFGLVILPTSWRNLHKRNGWNGSS